MTVAAAIPITRPARKHVRPDRQFLEAHNARRLRQWRFICDSTGLEKTPGLPKRDDVLLALQKRSQMSVTRWSSITSKPLSAPRRACVDIITASSLVSRALLITRSLSISQASASRLPLRSIVVRTRLTCSACPIFLPPWSRCKFV